MRQQPIQLRPDKIRTVVFSQDIDTQVLPQDSQGNPRLRQRGEHSDPNLLSDGLVLLSSGLVCTKIGRIITFSDILSAKLQSLPTDSPHHPENLLKYPSTFKKYWLEILKYIIPVFHQQGYLEALLQFEHELEPNKPNRKFLLDLTHHFRERGLPLFHTETALLLLHFVRISPDHAPELFADDISRFRCISYYSPLLLLLLPPPPQGLPLLPSLTSIPSPTLFM